MPVGRQSSSQALFQAFAGAGQGEAGALGRVGEGCLLGQAVGEAAELVGELVGVGDGALEAAGEGAAVGDAGGGRFGGAEQVALVGVGAGEQLLADEGPGVVAALAGLGEAGGVGQVVAGEHGELGVDAGELGCLLGQVLEGVAALAFAVEVARLHVLDGGEARQWEAVEGLGGRARVEAGEGLLELGVDADEVDLAALELGVGGLHGLELGEQGGAALVGGLICEGGGLAAQGCELGLVVGLAAGVDLELLPGAAPAAESEADLLELGGGGGEGGVGGEGGCPGGQVGCLVGQAGCLGGQIGGECRGGQARRSCLGGQVGWLSREVGAEEAGELGAEGGVFVVEAVALAGEVAAAGGDGLDAADQAFDGGGFGEQGVVDGVLVGSSLEALELVVEGLVALFAGAQLGEQGAHAVGVGGAQGGGEGGVGEAGEQALVGVEVLEGGEQGVDSGAAQAEAGELGVGAGEDVAGVF